MYEYSYSIIVIIIIIIIRLFQQLAIRNCYTSRCHAGQHRYNRTQRTSYNTTEHKINDDDGGDDDEIVSTG